MVDHGRYPDVGGGGALHLPGTAWMSLIRQVRTPRAKRLQPDILPQREHLLAREAPGPARRSSEVKPAFRRARKRPPRG